MGRPTLFNEELLDEIVERLAGGEPMAQICRDPGMPTARTVRNWMEQRGDHVFAAIAGAREDGEDWLAAECLLIANTPQPGVIEKQELDKEGKLVVTERRTEDMLGHRKLQIETRLKLLAKWNPKKYGDKIEHSGGITLESLVSASMGKPAEGAE